MQVRQMRNLNITQPSQVRAGFARGMTRAMAYLMAGTTAFMIATMADAAIYKKVDADGNVSYSDIPDKTAEVVTVKPLTTVAALSADKIAQTLNESPAQTPTQTQAQTAAPSKVQDYSLTIVSPQADQTFQRMVDAISASVAVQPELRNGDHVQLAVDGQKPVDGMSLQIPEGQLERGEHTLKAKIISGKGQLLVEKAVSFFVLQPTAHPQIGITR